ncbi:MAG: bacillithiol system redox-active protein YtxJ [Cytophagales bacterium]
MNWIPLTNSSQLTDIKKESNQQPVLLFKHSTSCSISKTSLNRLERNWNEDDLKGLKVYYLDLLSYRSISNEITQTFGVIHESPQVLIIRDGKSVYDTSHFDIDYATLKAQIEKFQSKN